jgi:hypothetical protein
MYISSCTGRTVSTPAFFGDGSHTPAGGNTRRSKRGVSGTASADLSGAPTPCHTSSFCARARVYLFCSRIKSLPKIFLPRPADVGKKPTPPCPAMMGARSSLKRSATSLFKSAQSPTSPFVGAPGQNHDHGFISRLLMLWPCMHCAHPNSFLRRAQAPLKFNLAVARFAVDYLMIIF